MANFHDPVEFARDYSTFVKLSTLVDGLYIWEFLIALNFEWDIIRRRRPHLRTTWIYSVTRLATLTAVILDLIPVKKTTNCKVYISLEVMFPYVAFSLSSLLILLRIPPIWNKNRAIVILATVIWTTNVCFLILGVVQIRSGGWDSVRGCVMLNSQSNKPTLISMLVTDIALLLIMLVGLFRLRNPGGFWLNLGWLLWKQGIIWLLLATVAELLPVVFICLNLNDAFSMMFVFPAMVTMSISATRMYRNLADFFFHPDDIVGSDSTQRRRRRESHANFTINTHNQLEVAVHTTYDQYLGSQEDKDIPFVGMEGRQHDKPIQVSFHEGVRSNV